MRLCSHRALQVSAKWPLVLHNHSWSSDDEHCVPSQSACFACHRLEDDLKWPQMASWNLSWRLLNLTPDNRLQRGLSDIWTAARPPSFSSAKPSCGFSVQHSRWKNPYKDITLMIVSLPLMERKLRKREREHLRYDDHIKVQSWHWPLDAFLWTTAHLAGHNRQLM